MENRKARRALATVQRAATALKRGKEILTFVQENKNLLIEGAKEGVPPVSKIGTILFRKFGEDARHLPVRQWIGTLTRALLALEGWEVDQSGVRFADDPVFKSGSTYRRLEADDETEGDPALVDTFQRMIEGLTTAERRILSKVVSATLA